MIKIISSKNILDEKQQYNTGIVSSIITDVKKNGDKAVRKYEKKFSKIDLKSLRVTQKEIKLAYKQISTTQIKAIKRAKQILQDTEVQTKKALSNINIVNNHTRITRTFEPIASVGCYVPGGLALYPSSLIMGVVPAKVAGVKRIIVSTPSRNGKIDPMILVAAEICKVNEIYKIGGVQAIAAMSLGTKSIKNVDKIIGPGGKFVTLAKMESSFHTAIDMIAGPTELGIIADKTADPKFIAVDLISQAEHSKDTSCFLLTTSRTLAKTVQEILDTVKIQRSEIVKHSLQNNGFIIICKTDKEMIKLANKLAPEHLEILVKSPSKMAQHIHTPGLILLGQYTPSAASDYMLGSNHILPTNKFGKTRGSLSVLDFLKLQTKVESTKTALHNIQDDMSVFTKSEQLPNHLEAVKLRL